MPIDDGKRYGPEIDRAGLIDGLWHVDGKCERELFDEETIEAFEQRGDGFPLGQWIRNEFLQRSACALCGHRLGKARHEMPGLTSDGGGLFELWSCVRCGFWQRHALQDHGRMWSGVSTSVTRTFDPALPDACHHEFAQHRIRDPDKWHSVHPAALGVDVVFIESAGREWLIQVKRRRKVSSEGVGTLQKLLGTLLLKDGRYGDHRDRRRPTHAVTQQVGAPPNPGSPCGCSTRGGSPGWSAR